MKETENTTTRTKVYNVIIMDRSGSMWDIQKPAIMGFNEVLGGVKAAQTQYAETQEQYITLVLFDSSSIDEIYWNADPSGARHLTEETYVPGACTPLYDAMGRTLTRLEKELKGDTNHTVIVTVITDGLENSSQEYSGAAIKALVEHLKDEGWSFAYMGTDHDVHGVSVSLSITNVIKFEKNEADTMKSFRKERRARDKWFAEENCFFMANPTATEEQRIRFKKEKAMQYYDEAPASEAYSDRITPERVAALGSNEIFVFGSNDRGRHDGGAARLAVQRFGAQRGVPFGLQGRSFAIPTVGTSIGPNEIREAFHRFVEYARAHPEMTFLVTAIGCGNAGYTPEIMSRLVVEGIGVQNIHFPISFWKEFEKRGLI